MFRVGLRLSARRFRNAPSFAVRHVHGSMPCLKTVEFVEVGMPALSPSMEEGRVVSWIKNVGDAVETGDMLAEIETDKATVAMEAMDDGFLAVQLQPADGPSVAVNAPIGLLVEEEEDIPFALASFEAENGTPAAATTTTEVATPTASEVASTSGGNDLSTLGFEVAEVGMPALSPSMEVGGIASWNVSPGDVVNVGDIIAEIETDKATVGMEADEDGIFGKVLVEAGTSDIPVGQVIALIVEDAADVAALTDFVYTDNNAADVSAEAAAPAAIEAAAAAAVVPQTGPLKPLSPAVARLVALNNLDPTQIPASGQGIGAGRILKGDVLKALASGNAVQASTTTATATAAKPASAAVSSTGSQRSVGRAKRTFTDLPVSNMRKVIAQRLGDSKRTVPHHYVSVDVQMDNLLQFRSQLKAATGASASVNDYIIKASALALEAVPAVNTTFDVKADEIKTNTFVDVSVAVATPEGLITPIIKNASALRLSEISANMRDLAGRARENKLLPDEFMGGSFTISNLGMFGIKNFKAVINKPQSCILAVSGTRQVVVPGEGADAMVVQNDMTVTLSADQQCVDAVDANAWLQAFKGFLENPASMI